MTMMTTREKKEGNIMTWMVAGDAILRRKPRCEEIILKMNDPSHATCNLKYDSSSKNDSGSIGLLNDLVLANRLEDIDKCLEVHIFWVQRQSLMQTHH